MTKLVAIQMVSTPDIPQNLASIKHQLTALRQASPSEAMLVVVPECCLVFGAGDDVVNAKAEIIGEGPMQRGLKALAKEFSVYLVGGTIALKAPDGRNYAASLLISPNGEILAQYNKIHLFDVDVNDGIGQYRESDATFPGQDICVVETPIGRIGLAVCYDLRFSALFRVMREQQADIVVLPSAFTKETGQAHWEILLRSRAIENQCYVIGANQGGTHLNGRQTWGQSMIVDPWGEIKAQIAQGEGHVISPYDAKIIEEIRARMPTLSQQRLTSSQLKLS